MKKLLLLIIGFGALSTVAAKELYIIKKVNKGTHFLKDGQKFAGFLNNNIACGATEGGEIGGEACAVVSLLQGPVQQLYYLEYNVLVTATPAKNLMGFIQGSIVKGGEGVIGGDRGTAVYKLQKLTEGNATETEPAMPAPATEEDNLE